MKINIEITDNLDEPEVIIRCGRVDENIQRIQRLIAEGSSGEPEIVFFKENREFYFSVDEILFFETEGEHVYAHTSDDEYRIKQRLYELDGALPKNFIRVSKSTIVNASKIHSITRNIASSSMVEFAESHKHIYVSRRYYADLRQRLKERRI